MKHVIHTLEFEWSDVHETARLHVQDLYIVNETARAVRAHVHVDSHVQETWLYWQGPPWLCLLPKAAREGDGGSKMCAPYIFWRKEGIVAIITLLGEPRLRHITPSMVKGLIIIVLSIQSKQRCGWHWVTCPPQYLCKKAKRTTATFYFLVTQKKNKS